MTARNDDLRGLFEELQNSLDPSVPFPNGMDARVVKGFSALGKSVLRLEETSYFLSWVNIFVGVLILLFGGLQIWIMIHELH